MVITTGFFDGVHRGHRKVIEALVQCAKARGEQSMVVTFWPHPRNVLQQDAVSLRLLSSLNEKKAMLTALGVDKVEVLRFTKEFSGMTTEKYLRDVLVAQYGATAILLGYDNRMGCDASSADEVETLALSVGLEVIRVGAVQDLSENISSTKIRMALEEGKLRKAAHMLGYEYSLEGVVVTGNRLGRTMNWPTANMQLYEPLKMVPANGVYFVRVHTLDEEYYGMCNIGVRPTVDRSNARTIETHIFDFDQDIYGLDMRVTFIEKIRDEVRFADMDALKHRLALDKQQCLLIKEKYK